MCSLVDSTAEESLNMLPFLSIVTSYIFFCYLQKPYACQVPGCPKRYTDPSSLRKHFKQHANGKMPQQNSNTKVCLFLMIFKTHCLLALYTGTLL